MEESRLKKQNHSGVRGCLAALFVIAILIILLFAGIKYRTCYAKSEITASISSDGRYVLKIYMIGEPEWPFGATHCRLELLDDSRRIINYPFSIQDDGAMAREENFNILWGREKVRVIVSGSEQEDREYVLYFDGRVE